ncbi:methyltransferase domain-containing protein [Faecalicoccus pleomorphus]|uniref:methyltransferase domain-containing protein n=1 Tax=Faecalicoccus pleomorphus TaxID=1323 RepID=UPI00195FCFA0|nr:methyltransferase domain-containing protein [Faecalicoccus pleomorphus]MBM6764321.1 methyltransferase domain-containing protein [Faecalicoccus pleomorphus]MDM8292729.1 methyltransferase domain-containing protein [Faecalicoccus pleomorphus]
MLICPKCKEPLVKQEKSFVCANHHVYDIARQGYVNLSMKQKKHSGDNALMVKARSSFLESDVYDFMRQFICQQLSTYEIKTLLDAGCGQGYYTKAFSQIVQNCVGIDLSKEAILYASKQDKKTQYIVSSFFDAPFTDSSFDGIVSIFVPQAADEFVRLLQEKGIWIEVGPGPKHCLELKKVLYPTPYLNPMPSKELSNFELVKETILSQKKWIKDCWSLLEMTPYRYKTHPKALEKVKELQGMDVTIEFLIRIWRKK